MQQQQKSGYQKSVQKKLLKKYVAVPLCIFWLDTMHMIVTYLE